MVGDYETLHWLKHIHWPPKDLLRWQWILFHFYNTIVLCMNTCSCRGICSSSACIGPQHFMTPLAKTITNLHHFHLLTKVDLPPFVDNFYPERDFVLHKKVFIYALAWSPHLSFGSLLDMVYEFWDYLVFNDYACGFDFIFEICGHIAYGHVPPLISCLFVASWLLILNK